MLCVFFMVFILSMMFDSCEWGNHIINNCMIDFETVKCLMQAQNQADSADCHEKRKEEREKEKERYENAVAGKKQIDECEKYQRFVLERWGYPEKDAKTMAKELRAGTAYGEKVKKDGREYTITREIRKDNDYSFDANEAILELIVNEYMDNEAVRVFQEELPKYGISKDSAVSATKQYYADELFYRKEVDPYFYKIGDHVVVSKQMLIDMGLLDEDNDEDSDEDNDEDSDDETGIVNGNISSNLESPQNVNSSNTENPNSKVGDNVYLTEMNEISKVVISRYGYNKYTLSTEQKKKLDKIVAFMNSWSNVKVTISGHTCSIGTEAGNRVLGMRRAHSAKLYLVSQGIDESRIFEDSKAAEMPCASNDTENGRLENRRITFNFN